MPVYINRNLSDITFGFSCPFCHNNYKTKAGLITHTKYCSDNEESGESLEYIFVSENNSAADMINWQNEIIKLTKELVVSNELALLESQSPEHIREIIRGKMKTRTYNNYIEECDIYNVYEFFFGLSETDNHNRKEEACVRLMKMFNPQD